MSGGEKLEQLYKTGLDVHSRIISTFRCLDLDLSREILSNRKAFSSVDKLVILGHGACTHIDFGAKGKYTEMLEACELSENHRTKNLTNDKWPCDVNIVDIQCCYCGKTTYYDVLDCETSFATELASLEKINRVYAWSGYAIYDSWGPLGDHNSSPIWPISGNGNYYRFTKNGNGTVERKKIGNCIPILRYD